MTNEFRPGQVGPSRAGTGQSGAVVGPCRAGQGRVSRVVGLMVSRFVTAGVGSRLEEGVIIQDSWLEWNWSREERSAAEVEEAWGGQWRADLCSTQFESNRINSGRQSYESNQLMTQSISIISESNQLMIQVDS